MKFLRTRQLKQLSAFVIILTLFVLLLQFLMIDAKEKRVEETEYKIEFAQLAQLNNQKISLMVEQYLNGNKDIAGAIAAELTEQDHKLKTLRQGGRMDQKDVFVKPLTLLPAITFQGLKDDWENYKKSIYAILSTSGSGGLELNNVSSTSVGLESAKVKYKGLSITLSNWYARLAMDLNEEVESKRSGLFIAKIAWLFLDILLIGGYYVLFVRFVLQPMNALHENTKAHRHTTNLPPNELGRISSAINEIVENLKDATEFVAAIGKGNLNLDYKESFDKNYVPGNNSLADSLIEMQAKLRQLNEEEQKRQWANEGLTKFVDILRSSNDDLTVLGDKILSGLISYTNSNQGALYILNDEESSDLHLELVSLYAWDVKKYEQQKIKPGEGILGQTFLEKETTYLTSLPEEYVRITSGLGGANPTCILIVPLKVDKEVYGLVELASFNHFKEHEISFVEKLGETIASTLSSVKAAQKNKHLIEQFQQQTEEMRAQEEEMRQNMEELQATQEEIVRKEQSYIRTIQDLEGSLKKQISLVEYESLKARYLESEAQYLQRIKRLEHELSEKVKKSDDWVVADELNKTLRINLEALHITREELKRKQ